MCLILLALDAVAGRPWLLLANRDEFHARPSAAAQAWPDAPEVIGGRDLEAGGAWLALHRDGRYAAVTNIRLGAPGRGARSRGELVAGFVRGTATATDYAAAVAARRAEYGPFNLLVGDAGGACTVSSLDGVVRRLARGVHAFSNGSLADEWPKMRHLREGFSRVVAHGTPDDAALLALLADTRQPDDAELPDTGVGLARERLLAPIFIRGAEYGTRASTLAYARDDGSLMLWERRFGPDGRALGETRVEVGKWEG
jgi:uncharacterized protein with NRDE domain